MLWAVWGTLAFCLLVAGVGGWHVFREARAAWRRFRGFTELAGRAGDLLSARADEVVRKADGASAGAERLSAATARLSRSLAYARVVGGAGGSAGAALVRLRRATVPRK